MSKTDTTPPPADAAFFDSLVNGEQRFATVPVPGWERPARLQKLDGPTKLKFLDFQASFPRGEDDNYIDPADGLRVAAELAALSIVDDSDVTYFDTIAGREFLLRQDPEVLAELMAAAMDLSRLDRVPDDLKAAKKK